jgi:hypothetical protein
MKHEFVTHVQFCIVRWTPVWKVNNLGFLYMQVSLYNPAADPSFFIHFISYHILIHITACSTVATQRSREETCVAW